MAKNKNVSQNDQNAVANMVSLLRERDQKNAELEEIEERLQGAILAVGKLVPSCTVEHRTTPWSDKAGNSGTISGEVVEGQFEIKTDGVKRLLTLMSRINKGEGRFSHAVRGWATKGNVQDELSVFEV